MKHEVIDNRASRRLRVLLAAEIEIEGERRRAHLLNISESGAKLDADEVPTEGDVVILHREGIVAPGIVSWVIDHRFGVQFDTPVDSALIAEHAAPIWNKA
jgi:hypothetical protein